MKAQAEFIFEKYKHLGWEETWRLIRIDFPDKSYNIDFMEVYPLVQRDQSGRWIAYYDGRQLGISDSKIKAMGEVKRHIWKTMEYRYFNHSFKKGGA